MIEECLRGLATAAYVMDPLMGAGRRSCSRSYQSILRTAVMAGFGQTLLDCEHLLVFVVDAFAVARRETAKRQAQRPPRNASGRSSALRRRRCRPLDSS